MDIAIIGPEKFAFQDMVCIDLALSYRTSGLCSLVPELSEDACLSWDAPIPITLEVQVKGAKGRKDNADGKGLANLDDLVDYLLHYPPRKSEDCLLQRLMDQEERFALFVLTARCTDNLTELLLQRPIGEKPLIRKVSRNLVDLLITGIANWAPKKSTRLWLERQGNSKVLAKRPVDDFEKALQKITILEQETAETIEVHLHSMLRAEGIDALSMRGVLAQFADIVAESKKLQADAYYPILRKLAASSPAAVQPNNYHERGIEDDLEAQLLKEYVLLLTGSPRSGKSWTAKAIAGRLQNQGFEVRQGSSVEEAERFLTEDIGVERIYVLDDPMGSYEPAPGATTKLMRLRTLCEQIRSNRRLIVAQSEQVLLQVSSNRTKPSLAGKAWLRLEPLSIDVSKEIWTSVANMQSISQRDIDRVSNLIINEKSLRVPGVLAYLAQTWSDLNENPLDEEIILQAMWDASDFARTLADQSPAMQALLTASALATTASEDIASVELAFILNGGNELPALTPEHGRIVQLFGDSSREEELPPSYGSNQLLEDAQQHGVEILQRKRVIADQKSRYNFTHPYLRAGAQTLVTPDIPSDFQRIKAQLQRAIACTSPVTSLAAARNLRWLRLPLEEAERDAVFQIAYLGTRSLFPATRDCCFEFLIECADSLPEELLEKLPALSESMVVGLDEINTSHDVGFISSHYQWFDAVPDSELEAVKPYLEALDQTEPLALDLSLSRRILQALTIKPEELTAEMMKRLLGADEAIVRATAAELWVQIPRDNDEDILERLSKDVTPAMSKALLKALVLCWSSSSLSRRSRLLAIIVEHSNSLSSSTILFSRLVLFNRPEKYGDKPPWAIFTKLMPSVINNLPLSISFRDGRLNCAIDDAIEAVNPIELFPVIEAWVDRIIKRVKGFTLGDYELAIIEPLISIAPIDARILITKNLLSIKNTGVRIALLKWLADFWSELSFQEHELIKQFILKSGSDRRWLIATVLTRSEPPLELIKALNYPVNLFSLPTDELEKELNGGVFQACVHMFIGWPQPLWWYATHHSQNRCWEKVVRDLARSPDHLLHSVAFYEVARQNKNEELLIITGGLPDSALNDTFEMLLDFKMNSTGWWRSETWQCLLDKADRLGRLDNFIRRIDAVLEGILSELGDIFEWLNREKYTKKILSLLPNDTQSITFARDMHSTMTEIRSQIEEENIELYDQVMVIFLQKEAEKAIANPPRLYGSWGELEKIFKELGACDNTLSLLHEKRQSALELHNSVQDRFIGSPQPINLEGWVD